MKRICWALLLVTVPTIALADKSAIAISPAAAYANPGAVANNIREECRLPEYQAEVVRRQIESLGMAVKVVDKDQVPAEGRYLLLRIENAVSSGNAFLGHRKSVVTSVKLFEDGKDVARSTFARDSMGGFGGGFKGSCAVLERCVDTLGSDIKRWLQRELARLPASTPTAAAPAAATEPSAAAPNPASEPTAAAGPSTPAAEAK